jgi:hypothetical protein
MCWKETSGISHHKNTVVTDVRHWLDTFVYFVESELAPQTKYPILLGVLKENTFNEYKSIPCIYYNTEQLTRIYMSSTILYIIQELKPVEIWDYSRENIAILRSFGINARYVPLKTPTWYMNELIGYRKKGIFYDVGFSGILTNRRLEILQELENSGLLVNKIECFGKERDIELAKCAIILNIHAGSDYKIFESARCEPWLSIGVPVISESGFDDDNRCILTDYGSFVQTTVDNVLYTVP